MYGVLKRFFGRKKLVDHQIAEVSIAGLQHYRGNDLAELIKVGDQLDLQRQPNNPHDPNAIIVMWHNNKIGYIPRALAQDINRQLTAGMSIDATIIDIKPVRFGRKWIKIRLANPQHANH